MTEGQRRHSSRGVVGRPKPHPRHHAARSPRDGRLETGGHVRQGIRRALPTDARDDGRPSRELQSSHRSTSGRGRSSHPASDVEPTQQCLQCATRALVHHLSGHETRSAPILSLDRLRARNNGTHRRVPKLSWLEVSYRPSLHRLNEWLPTNASECEGMLVGRSELVVAPASCAIVTSG